MRISTRLAETMKFRRDHLPGLWHTVRREVETDLRRLKGLGIARNAYDSCVVEAKIPQAYWPPTAQDGESHATAGFAANMLQCLQRNHDSIVRDINLTYWNSLAGS